MKRLLYAASVASILWKQIGDAAGPYDGEWAGFRDGNDGSMQASPRDNDHPWKSRDRPSNVRGRAHNICGAVRTTARSEPRSASGISQGNLIYLEGTFNGFGCAWKMMLRINKPR
jgi:hypothetical protein